MAFSLFGLMIIIWCSCSYLKMLSPWQPCKWTFWLICVLFLLKINLIHRKSLQGKICTISFTVGIPCGLSNGYCWVKVILTLCISMWFREKIDTLSDDPQNWCTLGNKNVFVELRRFRRTSQTYLLTEREWFATRDWALTALLEKNWSCWMGMARILSFISSSLVDLLPRMPGRVFINLSGPISSLYLATAASVEVIRNSRTAVIQNLSGLR